MNAAERTTHHYDKFMITREWEGETKEEAVKLLRKRTTVYPDPAVTRREKM